MSKPERVIIPKHDEYASEWCHECEEQYTLKVKRLIATTNKRRNGKAYWSVVLDCKCDNCGHKQTVQLVEMP